jgi:hypothetical protein
MKQKPSVDFSGYWQRHIRTAWRLLFLTVAVVLLAHLGQPLCQNLAGNLVLILAKHCVASEPSEILPKLRRGREPDLLAAPNFLSFVRHLANSSKFHLKSAKFSG